MPVIPFQKPDRVVMQKADDFQGIFEFKPLEPGYGVTIGNALRRILLSSLEGYAITSVYIPGVEHEFSNIKGVTEDVVEIVLNLKQVRFKKKTGVDESEKIFISVGNQEILTAGDLGKFSNNFIILNPELLICTMDVKANFMMELTIDKGRGYVPAEEHKIPDANVGCITIDSIYTPIKNVKYLVDNTRVEQKTDYEKLIIDIKTDGSIHPEEALKEASRILIQHFMLFSDESMTLETKKIQEVTVEVDEGLLHMRKILKTPLSDLDLSVRAYNCLKAAEIKYLYELVQYDIAELLKFRNFGKKSLSELEEMVRDRGLTFGMELSKYKLDEE
jgi:DNA-directed RNA polymerase subunit alpha